MLVEIVFSWPGIGRYAVLGVEQFDYNAIMGTTLVIAFIYVLMNLVVDILVCSGGSGGLATHEYR